MATKRLNIRGTVGLPTSIGTAGTTDPVLTRTPGTTEIKEKVFDSSLLVSSTLPSAQILIGNGSNVATARALSGAIALNNLGVTAINSNYITSSMINSAGIAVGKLALTTNNIIVGTAGLGAASTNLPTGITIGSAYIYRVGGTDVAITDGGTGISTLGTALQVLRVNAGATGLEYATMSTTIPDAVYGDVTVSGGGATWTVAGILSGLTATRIPFADGANSLTDASTLTFTGGDTLNTTNIVLGNGLQAVSAQVGTLTLVSPWTVQDGSANELLKFVSTASAVNEITITNAATGTGPTIAATGETNVPITINSKGTSAINLTSPNQATAASGNIVLTTGNVAGGAGNSGNIVLTTGTSAGGARGSITMSSTGAILLSAVADQASMFHLTSTMPSVITGATYGTRFSMTSAGSSSQTNIGFLMEYLAGYTGSTRTYAILSLNAAAGTGTTLIPTAGNSAPNANIGTTSASTATTAGSNAGAYNYAFGGNVNIGSVGIAQGIKNSATNIGVKGSAVNTGTSGLEIGGWFSLNQTTIPTESAALIADNGSQSAPIFLAKDDGVTVFTIDNGGDITAAGNIEATTLQATALFSGRVLISGSSGTITTDTGLTFNATTNALSIDNMTIHNGAVSATNVFIGSGAGNFTLSGSTNVGIGPIVGQSLTSGFSNVFIGASSGAAVTTGSINVAIGVQALNNSIVGSSNVAVGGYAISAATGDANTAIGASAGDNLVTGNACVFIGYGVDAPSTSADGQLVIQNIIFGTGNTDTGTTISANGKIGIGVATPARRFHVQANDAATNDIVYLSRITRTTSSTAAIGFGTGLEFELESNAGSTRVGGTVDVVTTTATNGAEAYDMVFKTMVGGAAATEHFRFGSNKIGFFASPTVVKQTSGANLTNSVTSGGVNDTITDWTNLTTYSTDAAAIRNAVYQLARKLKQVNDALRLYGLLT